MKYLYLVLLLLCFLVGCSSTFKVKNINQRLIANHIIQVGGNWGGIIEDNKIDAVTGATKSSIHIGYHPVLNIQGHVMETGIDFLNYNQSFTYLDHSNNFDGKREFNYAEIKLPITYNFQLFRDDNNEGRLIIKLGISSGYRIFESIKDSKNIPEYTFDKLSFGPTFGLSSTPIKLNNKLRIGIYLDFVRASKVYKDYYTVDDGVGNMSNLKFGAILKIR